MARIEITMPPPRKWGWRMDATADRRMLGAEVWQQHIKI